jgi:hypothetical protein
MLETPKIPEKQKENIRTAISLYQKKALPGPRGIYHFTYIQDSKVCSIQEIDLTSPHWSEVSNTDIVVLCLFA